MKTEYFPDGREQEIDFSKPNILLNKESFDIVLSRTMYEQEYETLKDKGRFQGLTVYNGNGTKLVDVFFRLFSIDDFILMPGELTIKND